MTKDGNIKRAARARAKHTGESYAKARADLEQGEIQLATQILGEAPVSIEQVLVSGRGYEPPFVHRVRTADGQIVYLKHGPASKTGGSYALEAWAYRLCAAHGVLVPEVVDAAEPGAEFDYIATIELTGGSLWKQRASSSEAWRAILHRAGEQIRAMHEIQLEGYGPITTPGRGSHATWCPTIDVARTEHVPNLVDCGAITPAEADDIERILAEGAAHIPADGPSRLLHGDLEGDHIFNDGDRFTGLIDFGTMQAGDPVYDLARFAWWDAYAMSELLDGYGHDRFTDEDLQIRMPAYVIANATRTVGEVQPGIAPSPRVREFVMIARGVRFGRSSGRVTANASPPQSPQEILANAVRAQDR